MTQTSTSAYSTPEEQKKYYEKIIEFSKIQIKEIEKKLAGEK